MFFDDKTLSTDVFVISNESDQADFVVYMVCSDEDEAEAVVDEAGSLLGSDFQQDGRKVSVHVSEQFDDIAEALIDMGFNWCEEEEWSLRL